MEYGIYIEGDDGWMFVPTKDWASSKYTKLKDFAYHNLAKAE